ncbi:hypothetical protein SL057_002151 [Flavobacterium psychrophilum]|nr:hypothetical protein [Flavobacterium psychrophilum]
MNYERSIKFALDKTTGQIIDADEVFYDRLIGFDLRKKYNRDEITPFCLECENQYSVSSSKLDRLHFKHIPTDEYCILKDENLSPKVREEFYEIYKSKESERHKFLKNRIGSTLSQVAGVSEIYIDNKFIFNGKEKRKPDVYCKYFDKEIVFEIQLSKLSQRYILNRFDFYRTKGIYLIWILDNFDVLGQTQMEKDIKYLSKHQNFFKLDEETDIFKFQCTYKFTFLSNENKFMDKWNKVFIQLDKLKFDTENFEAYFYNFGQEKETILELQKKNEIRIKDEILKKEIEDQKAKEAKEKVEAERKLTQKIDCVLNEIKILKDKHIAVYDSVTNELRDFEENELEAFNLRLNLDKNNKLVEWFTNANSDDFSFLKFILKSGYIEYDTNLIKDSNGSKIIDFIYNNKQLPFLYFFKLLLKRGYKFCEKDKVYILNSYPNEEHKAQSLITISLLSNQFENPNFIQYLFDFETVVCIIESAKQDRIIGYKYKPNEWINFANNVIQYYPKYWEYIELAFKQFGLFDKLIDLDVKESFRKKLLAFYSIKNDTNYSFDYLFSALYPEIGGVNSL